MTNLYDGATAEILNVYNGVTQAISLNSNGNSYFNNGNVGIGTATPGAYLDVNPTYTGATVTSLYGRKTGFTLNNAAATVTNWYGNYISAPTVTAGTLTNKYALVTEANAGNVGIGTIYLSMAQSRTRQLLMGWEPSLI